MTSIVTVGNRWKNHQNSSKVKWVNCESSLVFHLTSTLFESHANASAWGLSWITNKKSSCGTSTTKSESQKCLNI